MSEFRSVAGAAAGARARGGGATRGGGGGEGGAGESTHMAVWFSHPWAKKELN